MLLLSTLVSKYLFEPLFSTLLCLCSPGRFLALRVGAACSVWLQGMRPALLSCLPPTQRACCPHLPPHYQPHCCALLGVGHVPCHLVRPTISGHTSAASPPWCFRAIKSRQKCHEAAVIQLCPNREATVRAPVPTERPLLCPHSDVPGLGPLVVQALEAQSSWSGQASHLCLSRPRRRASRHGVGPGSWSARSRRSGRLSLGGGHSCPVRHTLPENGREVQLQYPVQQLQLPGVPRVGGLAGQKGG